MYIFSITMTIKHIPHVLNFNVKKRYYHFHRVIVITIILKDSSHQIIITVMSN